jgi:hypothetical protein
MMWSKPSGVFQIEDNPYFCISASPTALTTVPSATPDTVLESVTSATPLEMTWLLSVPWYLCTSSAGENRRCGA